MMTHHIPGLSIAVMQDGKLIYLKAFGFSNLEHKVPAKPNTAFAIASISKSFTAIAVMQLVERGKLSLNDVIDQHLIGLPAAWKGISIRQLLNHTSGIPSFVSQAKIECAVGKQVIEYVRGDAWKEVGCLPMLFEPGTQWSYGDTGYYLLGMLIEKITCGKYEEFMQNNIFLPLGMHNSRIMSYTELTPNRADGYAFRNGRYYLAKRWEIDEFSSSGIISTAEDMIQMHLAFTSEKLLKKKTWQQMWEKTVLKNDSTVNYGLGLGLTPFQGRPRIGHYGGGGLGFASGLTHFPKENLTVVVLSNTDNEDIGTLVNTIASFYFE
jgi:CubicO group peptidase (beta-lactamase class C family)